MHSKNILLFLLLVAFLVGAFLISKKDLVDKTEEKTSVKVYFSHNQKTGIDCTAVFAVKRQVEAGSEKKVAVEALLEGPTREEKSVGFITNIPENVKINNFQIEKGLAKVDFNEKLNKNTAGSCRVMAIRAQITETLLQFEEINEVVISVNGESEGILQP
jgi:spore germination protein GerM